MKFFWVRFFMWLAVILFGLVVALMRDNTLMGVANGFLLGVHVVISVRLFQEFKEGKVR